MKRIAIALAFTLVASTAFAGEPAPAQAPGWKPSKVTKPDPKGVDAAYKAMEDAWKKNDMEAAAALIDFPVFMLTDSSAGATMGETWTKEKWLETMKASMANMPKDLKVNSSHKATFISDALCTSIEDHSATMGKTKSSWKSASMMVKKDGKWMFKTMAEGGWGDMPMPEKKADAMAPKAEPKTAAK